MDLGEEKPPSGGFSIFNPKVILRVINPTREAQQRTSSVDLKEHSDWLRHSIKENELANTQLPDKIITRKRPIKKPEHW